MKFAEPLWLLIGIAACAALLWRYRQFDRRQRVELTRFASDHLVAQLTASVSNMRRNLKRALILAGVALVAVALARPLAGFHWEETKRQGLDLLFAVDTSRSMLAQDVKPDRLTRAKMAVEDLLQKLEGDRVGLIAFAGNAFLQCPLTLDYDAFHQSLEALDTSVIPRGGTDIAAAIHEAEAALETQGNHERILVLLTDGEDLEGQALDAARAAAKNGLIIFTVGVGSANGELIPVPDEKGDPQFVKDASGQFAKSRLDESMLRQIAEATGGMYQPLGQQAQGLETLYRDGLSKFTRHELASRMHKVYLERFQWPLCLGLLCLVLEPLIGIRRRRFKAERTVAGAPRKTTAKIVTKPRGLETARPAVSIAGVALALLVFPSFGHASVGSAERAYAKGQFDQAAQEYQKAAGKNPQKAEWQFNHGAAAYKAGQHEAAAAAFAKAMKTDDAPLREDNFYNLGNTQYRLGQKTEKSNVPETIKTWEQSVQSYESALQLKADDADAKYNRDLVKKKLEELKKQQQQNQQQQQKQDQKPDQQDQKNSQDKNPKQDGKQDSKDQSKQDGSSGNQDNKDQKPGQSQPDDKKGQPAGPGATQNPQLDSDKDQRPDGGQDKKGQTAQTPDKPQPRQDRGSQKPELANKNGGHGGKKDDAQNEPETARVPGKMSKLEAKQLLDSLKDGDRKMPLTPAARGNETSRQDEPLRDW